MPLPLQSQIIPTSHEFIVNICQSRLNGPLPKMLTKNKASAFTAGSSFPERSGVRKTCRYRVITKQQSPQAKNSSDKLRMILDSITSIVFASSQAPSCLDLPFQYCSGEFQQNNSEAPGSHCEHEDSSHSSAFLSPAAASPVMSRRQTPRSSRHVKHPCHQPSPIKLNDGADVQLRSELAFDLHVECAEAVPASHLKENVTALSDNVVFNSNVSASGGVSSSVMARSSANQSSVAVGPPATTAITPNHAFASHTSLSVLPSFNHDSKDLPTSQRNTISQQEISSHVKVATHFPSQPSLNAPQFTASVGQLVPASANCTSRPRRTAAKQCDHRLNDACSQSSSQGDCGGSLSQSVRQMSVVDVFAAMRQCSHAITPAAAAAAASAAGCKPCAEIMQLLYVHSSCDRKDHSSLLHLYGVTSQRKNVTAVVAGFFPCIYVRPSPNSPLVSSSLEALVSRLNLRLRPPSLSPSSSSKDWRIARGIARAGEHYAAAFVTQMFLFCLCITAHSPLQRGAKKLLCMSRARAFLPSNSRAPPAPAFVSLSTTTTHSTLWLICFNHLMPVSLVWAAAVCGRTAAAAPSNFARNSVRILWAESAVARFIAVVANCSKWRDARE